MKGFYLTKYKHTDKKLSLYTKFLYCMVNKDVYEPFELLAKEADTTEHTAIKKLYEIDEGKVTKTGKKIIEAIKKLCPKAGLIKHIKERR